MKHPQFLTDILNHPDISEADKETAKAEVERMITDEAYRDKVGAWLQPFTLELQDGFIWEESDSGDAFWRKLKNTVYP
jgi:hypothetical protein